MRSKLLSGILFFRLISLFLLPSSSFTRSINYCAGHNVEIYLQIHITQPEKEPKLESVISLHLTLELTEMSSRQTHVISVACCLRHL
jgi:hypothetical protein